MLTTQAVRIMMVQELKDAKTFEGLRGWLILIGMGVVLSPFRILAQLMPEYINIFTDGTWQMLTTPGTEAYIPFWAPLIIGEILINLGYFIARLYLIYLFFSKRQFFPKFYIGLLVFGLLVLVTDSVLVKIIIPDEPIFDKETIRELTFLVLGAIVWIPYMRVSRRVKATFVK